MTDAEFQKVMDYANIGRTVVSFQSLNVGDIFYRTKQDGTPLAPWPFVKVEQWNAINAKSLGYGGGENQFRPDHYVVKVYP